MVDHIVPLNSVLGRNARYNLVASCNTCNLKKSDKIDTRIAKVKECCKDIRSPRDGKTVYIGSSWKDIAYTDSEGESKTITMRIVYEVIERTADKNGQFLLVPDIECSTIWTNLGWSDDAIINGYHAHGKCEQFHSEIKTDMDVERLPSGKFDTDELVLELTERPLSPQQSWGE